jgi:hypothetical protein
LNNFKFAEILKRSGVLGQIKVESMRAKLNSFWNKNNNNSHELFEKIFNSNLSLKQLKARLFQKCNDAHEFMLILKF